MAGIEYQFSKRKTLTHSSGTNAHSWVIGIELNLAECPRIFPEGEGAASSEDFGQGAAQAHCCGEINSRVAQLMRGDDVLASAEKAANKAFENLVHTSVSYGVTKNGRAKVNNKTYLGDFQTLKNGNDLPEQDEYDSELDEEINGAKQLTRWESDVLSRFWNFFASVPVGEDGDEPGFKAILKPGVTSVAAHKYLLHDLRTIKMRCLLRGVDEDCGAAISQAYNFAQQYFNEG